MHVAAPFSPSEPSPPLPLGSPSPESRDAFPAGRYTAWLLGPMALVLLLTKAHKLIATPGGDFGSALAALFPDVVFLLGFALTTWLLMRFLRGPLRPVARVVLHLVVLVVTVLIFTEHAFWLTTGTLLDPYTLGYGLTNIGALGKVYLSEMGVTVWLGLAALLLVHWLPLRVTRKRTKPPTIPLAVVTALALVPAGTCVAALAVKVTPPLVPLSENVVVEFASEAFTGAANEAPQPEVQSPFELVLHAPLPGTPTTHKNVIVIVMESLRARATSLYDEARDTTPFLESLAARGARAEHAWTTVTHTSKAIVGVLCGLYPKLDVPIDEAEPAGLPPLCLAHLLRERGYATAFMQTATAHFERRDQLVKNMDYETFLSKETIPQRHFEETSYFGWEDEALIAPAMDFVKQQQAANKPFFLSLLTLSTHHTYGTPSTFTKTDRGAGEVGQYRNAVAYLDQTLAKLFAELDAAGVLDETLIVLTGDHGEGFGEHGRRQHDAVIYEEGLHVPIIVLGPGVTPGTTLSGLRSTIDIAPTVLEWLGTPVASGLPGQSLLSTSGHEHVFASCWLRNRCIATRTGDRKFIWHYDRQAPEVFDIKHDPLEREDLFIDLNDPEVASAKGRLIGWKADNIARWASYFAVAAREFVTKTAPEPQHPLDITYASPPTTPDGDPQPLMRLIGVDMPQVQVTSGDPIRITLYWETLSPPGAWTPFTHLLGVTPGARPRYNGDHTPVGGRHPTSLWVPGTFVADEFRLQPSTDLEPGRYDLVVGLWDASSTAKGAAGRALAEPSDDFAGMVDAEHRAHVITLEVLPKTHESPPIPAGDPNAE